MEWIKRFCGWIYHFSISLTLAVLQRQKSLPDIVGTSYYSRCRPPCSHTAWRPHHESDKYSLLMHRIKIKSPANFLWNEQHVFVCWFITFQSVLLWWYFNDRKLTGYWHYYPRCRLHGCHGAAWRPHHDRQATGLDAWASRVKCPARFVSHLHEICIYELFIAFVCFVVCSLL